MTPVRMMTLSLVTALLWVGVAPALFGLPEFMTTDGLYTEFPNDEVTVQTNVTRLLFSYLSTPILDLLRICPAPYYFPLNALDPFDYLRDVYVIPIAPWASYKEYDFVVVGGGSAGCVVASRLSEGGKWTVLLLEVGKPEGLVADIPLAAASLQGSSFNWGYRTEPSPGVCLAMTDKRCMWPRGKALGGSSVINYMIYNRGNKIDYDRLAAAGNPGWSYSDVLPYFKKSERANLPGLENSAYHGKTGLWSVEYAPYKTRLSDAFLDAAVELGNNLTDYNQENQYGFSRIQVNTLNGKRHSSAKAFLHPFRTRLNLHILTKAQVTKINIDPVTKVAGSVQFVKDNYRYTVRARKEIILSAGALASPQLLMLSGVGPRSQLAALNIPVLKNLPVGQNMYDHYNFVGLPFLINTTGDSILESQALTVANALNWINNGKGVFTVPGGVEALGYIKTDVSNETGNYPDIELLFVPGGMTSDRSQSIRRGMGISDDFFNSVYGDIVEKPCWSIFAILLHPKSKGFMKLRDRNPFHWPRYYYDYFSDPSDLATLVAATKYIIDLSNTDALQAFDSTMHAETLPTCSELDFGTDAYWECAVRSLTSSLHHQIGSCKMGPAWDPEAVVDNQLRVYGISKLRVADASIIPKPLSGHTNAPAIMIGEKIADILKKTYNF